MTGEKEKLTVSTLSDTAEWEQSAGDDFSNDIFEEIGNPDYLHTISMRQLYQKTFSPKESVIEGILSFGTYILAGAPKVGKSFLVAQMAYHVSTGQSIWGYAVHQGTVLYLALEDDYTRLQSRLYKMFGSEDTENLHLAIFSKQLGNGLVDQVKLFLSKHPDTKVIIVDTLCRIRDTSAKYEYAADYAAMAELKQLSDTYGFCMLVVHHTRKEHAEDVFDMISGTNGLMGAADGALVLWKRKRTDKTATLQIVGRDHQDQQLHLERDEKTLLWNLVDTETEIYAEPPDSILEAIAELVTPENPKWVGSASELLQVLHIDKAPNALTAHLNVHLGRLKNDYNIVYENSHTRSGSRLSFTLCM